MDSIVIIPARGGSKGVPKKNITLIHGFPLIAYSIAAAKLSGIGCEIIVSTDSEEIASVAEEFGAAIPFLRPKEYARDDSTDKEFLVHAMRWYQANRDLPEYWIHLRPTTPLRNPEVIMNALSTLKEDSEATSLRSGHLAPESPQKWFRMDSKGYFKPLMASEGGVEMANLPRQSFPPVYIPDGYVDIIKASYLLNSADTHGDRMVGFESPFCSEIDVLEDIQFIEFELSRRKNGLLDYLQDTYPDKWRKS